VDLARLFRFLCQFADVGLVVACLLGQRSAAAFPPKAAAARLTQEVGPANGCSAPWQQRPAQEASKVGLALGACRGSLDHAVRVRLAGLNEDNSRRRGTSADLLDLVVDRRPSFVSQRRVDLKNYFLRHLLITSSIQYSAGKFKLSTLVAKSLSYAKP